MKSHITLPTNRRVPPELIGIVDDARRECIDTFTLEYSRDVVMATLSAPNRAMEIDFELEAGEEMLHFLRAGAFHRKTEKWSIRCTYRSEIYQFLVQQTSTGRKSPLRITWSLLSNEKPA